jgi:hypothetical protein
MMILVQDIYSTIRRLRRAADLPTVPCYATGDGKKVLKTWKVPKGVNLSTLNTFKQYQ